jgi:endoglucanase
LDAPTWNSLFSELLGVVRQTNPTRIVVVGPTSWNSFKELPNLQLPADPNLLVTFHYYEPFRFTHQGASWTNMTQLHGITWGSEADRARLAGDFAKVAAWSKASGRPVLLGEFGAYDQAPLDSRVAYTAAVARAAEQRGWAWSYWQFDSNFVVYLIDEDRWNEPIYRALVPAP